MAEKIRVKTPLVELDGDEMTRVMWRMVKEKLLFPYLDMQIQLLSWMGLSARVGYLWAPVELDWSDNGQLDSPQDLSPSGVYVRCSIMFGGIGRTGSAEDSIGRDEELRLLRAESVVSGNGAADSEEEANGVPEED